MTGNSPNVVVVEGDDWRNQQPFNVRLVRRGPGDVLFTLTINGTLRATVPLDNFVKAAGRIDPDYATGAEREIQKLRVELGRALSDAVDAQMAVKRLIAERDALSGVP
jgi:hypothetical protein